MNHAQHSVSVSGVIVDAGGRALVVRRSDNQHWEPPGGVLEVDEPILDGLRREIAEETGLEVSVGQLSGVYKNMRRAIIALVFRCEQSGGTLRLNSEVTEFGWMTPEEIRANLDEAYAVRVLDALDAGATAIRSHDGQALLAH